MNSILHKQWSPHVYTGDATILNFSCDFKDVKEQTAIELESTYNIYILAIALEMLSAKCR